MYKPNANSITDASRFYKYFDEIALGFLVRFIL